MRKIYMLLAAAFILQLFLPTAMPAQSTESRWLTPYILAAPEKGHYYASAIGDINDDGLDDMVVNLADIDSLPKEYAIIVYLQDGNGRMENFVKYLLPSSAYQSVSIGDVNGDGLNDVVVSSYDGIGIFYQNDTGTLNTVVSITGDSTFKVLVDDIDGDGDDDVVALNNSAAHDISVYRQNSGILQAPDTYSLLHETYKDIRIGDLNNDGRKDIVLVRDQGTLSTIIGILHQTASPSPAGTFDAAVYHSSTFVIGSCAVDDVDNDGRDDLVVTSANAATLKGFAVYAQNAGGTLDSPVLYNVGVASNYPVAIFDMNHDGLNDIVMSTGLKCYLFLQEIATNTFNVANMEEVNTPYGIILNTQAISTGDLDADGRTDLVIANYNYGAGIFYGSDNTPKMGVRAVNGGYFEVNESIYIEWGGSDDIDKVDIYYSTDNGFSWTVIDSSIEFEDGWYLWDLPFIAISDNVLLRVANALGGLEATSKVPFAIADDGVERIMITGPNGGEVLVAGTNYDITWTTTAAIGDVYIEYSTDQGTSWQDVVASTENTGTYTWTVPAENSTTCYLRISEAADGSPTDRSDSVFSMLPAGSESINVTAPNGGEGLEAGSIYNVTWTTTGSIAAVVIELSTDNGASWPSSYRTTVPDTGSLSWIVPFVSSSQCLIRICDIDQTVCDRSNSTFSIGAFGSETITITSPNGGESFWIGASMPITWTGTGPVDNVKLEYSTNNGTSWTTIIDSTLNTGVYDWNVPDAQSDQCLIRISDASDNDPTDVSDAVFSIKPITPAIMITSPKGGESWAVGVRHDITWNSYGGVGNVKIQYSTDNKATWNTITSSTSNDGIYAWTIPNTPSDECFIKISEASDGVPSGTNNKAFSIVTGNETPQISIDHQSLYFAAVQSSSSITGYQYVLVKNSGIGTMKWNAVKVAKNLGDNIDWLRLHNDSGIQSGMMEVYVEPFGFGTGTYSASIKVSAEGADNTPLYIDVTLNIYATGADAKPFGSFDTPGNGETVMSSIPVTGWVLDDIGVDNVTIWRSPVSGEGKGLIYIGEALLVDGARPDVELAYPTTPASYKAGWGYMMLTNALPNGGNGTFTLYAYAKDVNKQEFLLGTKTIICDNANAVKPFGAIDSPAPGGTASSVSYRNNGWVLTPMPNSIPTDGSTLKAYVDGQYIGQPAYNVYRHDIASFFPGYANSNGAMAYLDFDTTEYDDGLHTIQWTATDTGGNTDGIGSRFFTILNSGYQKTSASTAAKPQSATLSATAPKYRRKTNDGIQKTWHRFSEVAGLPLSASRAVGMKLGYGNHSPVKLTTRSNVDKNDPNAVGLTVPLNERLVLYPVQPGEQLQAGYLQVGQTLRRLPAGSSVNYERGVFYWQVCPGYLGTYKLVFVVKDKTGKITRKHVNVRVAPGFEIKKAL